MANFYENKLQGLLNDPGSFQATPGYQFALGQATDAANRGLNARGMGGSGNALAELTKLGAGYASQEYGNQVDRLGRLTGQQQQYDLGKEQNANQFSLGSTRNANDFALGGQRNSNDYNLGMYRASNDFGLGSERNAIDAQANRWNALHQNRQFDLGQQRNAIDWFGAGTNQQNADTNRGNALANNYFSAAKLGMGY